MTQNATNGARLDPAIHLMPDDQLARVFGQKVCDIDHEFLGFTEKYLALASIIPLDWTVVDLGCAYAPQALIFKDHKAYVGVDVSNGERFSAPNTTHYSMTTADFIAVHSADFDIDRTFAICSYVPNWFHQDSRRLTREAFKNVFTFYPARDLSEPTFPLTIFGVQE